METPGGLRSEQKKDIAWIKRRLKEMNYLPSNLSNLEDGVAFIGETSLLDVAKEYGTPLYVYDWEHLRDNIRLFYECFWKRDLYLDMQQKRLSAKP